jgi:hypothetical protein
MPREAIVNVKLAIRGVRDFGRQMQAIADVVALSGRRMRRLEREVLIRSRPGWLPALEWSFPTSPRPFDWFRDCPTDDIAPHFPPVVGRGRGVVMGVER